jgi:hypothetical protein
VSAWFAVPQQAIEMRRSIISKIYADIKYEAI